ncbi:MAG: hypothetical protein Q4D60_06205 [Eubacteriales bacterium]|nr:hypothetical protein [Eubacteriales bacterium]
MSPSKKNKIRKLLRDPSQFLEHTMAMIVFISILIATISLWEPFLHYLAHRGEHYTFLIFIGEIFNVVIGIEFLKLLCKPGKDTLLEVLMFVVARHMIIEKTSTVENLTSIVTILILFITDRYFLSNPSFACESSEKEEKEDEE